MNILHQAARQLERLEALDKVAKPLAGAVGRAVRPRVVRNLLSGTCLGHAVAWTGSATGEASQSRNLLPYVRRAPVRHLPCRKWTGRT